MDAVGAVFNVLFFILVIYLISRVAHFMNNTTNKLKEIDEKLEELRESNNI
ncbi:hypothetical protein ACFOGI_04590 [Virgibacillus xinjiangensis]|uniref:Uncharacterized protein n=1 Tax=Virgibacillus xinjiangensis TaxID=393090 RepID=A0ABV7CSY7_9BACI